MAAQMDLEANEQLGDEEMVHIEPLPGLLEIFDPLINDNFVSFIGVL